MPIDKNWSTFSEEKIKDLAPNRSGVYELQAGGYLVYIGSTKDLERRLLEHLQTKNAQKFRCKQVDKGLFGLGSGHVKAENEHLSRFEDNKDRLPSWNENDTR